MWNILQVQVEEGLGDEGGEEGKRRLGELGKARGKVLIDE